jgi:hypothetical protein
LFVAEALWAALYATIDKTFVSALLAGVILTVAWSVWMVAKRDPLGAPAVVAQAAYTLFAAWLLVDLPAPTLPLAWVAVCVAGLAIGRRLEDGVRLAWDLTTLTALGAAPVVGYVVAELGAPDSAMGALDLTLSGQIAMLLSLLILGGLGWDQGRRGLLAVSAVQAYLLYAWVLVDGDVAVEQLYSAPLALMFLALAWLLAEVREPLEGVASAALLLPAAAQAAAHDTVGYSLLLGAWGLALLVLGISTDRRVLLVSGIVGLLLAALRQLWEIVELLPPGLAVGVVGLGLMIIAVLLTWRRDTVLDLGRRGGRYWDRMGRDTSR